MKYIRIIYYICYYTYINTIYYTYIKTNKSYLSYFIIKQHIIESSVLLRYRY